MANKDLENELLTDDQLKELHKLDQQQRRSDARFKDLITIEGDMTKKMRAWFKNITNAAPDNEG